MTQHIKKWIKLIMVRVARKNKNLIYIVTWQQVQNPTPFSLLESKSSNLCTSLSSLVLVFPCGKLSQCVQMALGWSQNNVYLILNTYCQFYITFNKFGHIPLYKPWMPSSFTMTVKAFPVELYANKSPLIPFICIRRRTTSRGYVTENEDTDSYTSL